MQLEGKDNIKQRNEEVWEEERDSKSSLQWYNLAKNGAGVERYVRFVQG